MEEAVAEAEPEPSSTQSSNVESSGANSSAPLPSRFTRQQWGLLLVLAAVYFTHVLDFVIVMPLGDQLRQQLHITPQQFGAVVSAYGIAAMFAGIASSVVVDLFDRKKVLVTAFCGFTVATFYCGFAPDYTHLLIARCLTGIFGGLSASSVMAVIGDVFPDRQRGKAIGIVTSSFAVASTIGLPIGLWLAIQAGNWNAPFLAIGGLAVLVWVLAAICLPSLTGHRTGVASSPLVQFAKVVKHPNHLWSFVFMLATILGTFIIVPYIAPYLQANCGRTASDLPIVYSVAGVCTLVSMNIVGWATDRVGARPVFLLCAGGAVLMTLVITNLPPIPLLGAVVTTSCFMVLASGRIIPAQTMMLRASDPAMRGAFMNLNTAVSHFATAVGPLITGSIVGEEYAGGPLTGYAVAGLVAAFAGGAAIALSFRLRPFHQPQIAVAG